MRAIIYIKKEKIQRDEKERFAENAVSSPWNRSFYDQRSSDSLFSFLFSTSLRREKKAREFQRLFLEKISKERKREMAPRVYTLWNLWCDGSENWNERLRVRDRKVAEKKNLYVKNWELSLKRGNERMLMYDTPFHSICASKSVRTFYEITMLPSEDLLVLVHFWFFCHVAMV